MSPSADQPLLAGLLACVCFCKAAKDSRWHEIFFLLLNVWGTFPKKQVFFSYRNTVVFKVRVLILIWVRGMKIKDILTL